MTAKTFEDRYLDMILLGMQPLLIDADRYKQRAGAEILVGLLRGKTPEPFPSISLKSIKAQNTGPNRNGTNCGRGQLAEWIRFSHK